ncbi:MAG: hypothetical protein M1477_00005 [Candidatus Thermoplasmatota archaeon]|nr:hypothetical protein [Candidatus Thermoplasmatota archaeon]MCL5989716.1 hypothetical protein [Candidatus Thermoplasmatota archaeon]
MGRTIPTMRQSVEELSTRIERMGRLMNKDEMELLIKLILKGRKHAHEASYSSLDPEFSFALSVLIEMEKEIHVIRERLESLERE